MHYSTFLVAAAAAATVSADRSAVKLNAECDKSLPHATIVNRCDYDVHLWSVFKGMGCPGSEMVTLKKGETYNENLWENVQDPSDPTGISIKISKTTECKGNDITQLEYFLNTKDPKYSMNYLDVSYVDCQSDCPTRNEGFYLKAGDGSDEVKTLSSGNTWCPTLSCHDSASCAKLAYILPDDVQTKTCGLTQNLYFYMCGGEAPSAGNYSPPAPAPAPASSKQVESPAAPKPTTTLNKVVSSPAAYKVNAAAVTNAPEIKEKAPKIKTEVVYVTKYEYVNAKRHAHARRHQAHNA